MSLYHGQEVRRCCTMLDSIKRKIAYKFWDKILPQRPPVQPGSPDSQQADLQLPPGTKDGQRAEALLAQMHDDEKLAFVSGEDVFCIRGIPRLGLPRVWTSDATSGVRGLNVTVTDLPANVAMAATWNPPLIYKASAMVANECRATGIGVLLAPGVNIARVPVCGRNFEYMGEDPYLAGEMAAAYVQGVQSQGVIPTVKHFACNNSEDDRHKSNSVVDERTLREIYLPAFKRAVDAGTLGLMTSYNQVNGTYASEHQHLVQDILRKEWGFDGLVISDWNSLYSTAAAVLYGVDLEMPGPRWLTPQLLSQGIADGSFTMADIDGMVLHILKAFERAGLFDRPMLDANAQLASTDHQDIADAVADQGVVLLRNNEHLLPLDSPHVRSVVIIGRNALTIPTGGGGSSYIKPTVSIPLLEEELRHRLHGTKVVTLADDTWYKNQQDRALVQGADVVIAQTGFDNMYECESFDRAWKMPLKEIAGIRQACSLNANVIAIISGGGDLETASWIDGPKAILDAFYLGTRTAATLAKILTGEINPSGKLPFTMARELGQYRSMEHYPKHAGSINPIRMVGGQGDPKMRKVTPMPYDEGLLVGYRLFDTENLPVQFPFGHGLSYTSFSYGPIELLDPAPDALVSIQLSVTNTGTEAGSEVVQLYIHETHPVVFRPSHELKGFEKVYLVPGQTAVVRFDLPTSAFSYFDTESSGWTYQQGSFELQAGSSSRDIRQRTMVALQ